MIWTQLLILLIQFVVYSTADCVQDQYPHSVNCSGSTFDEFTNIGEPLRAIRVVNSPKQVFIVDQSKNPYLDQITYLDLRGTEALAITEYGFKNFIWLTELNLQRCSIEVLKGTWFLPNSKISYLDCEYNKLRTLFKSDLQNLKNLVYVSFSHNFLDSIEPDTFSEMYELRELSLTGNRLKSIPTGRLPMLQFIYLDNNMIHTVPANVFSDMPKLKYIYLQKNALTTIEDGAFRDLENVNNLFLGKNSIEEITPFTFGGTNIRWLDLSSNKIRRIPPGAFKEMSILQYLGLSSNLINELDEYMFEGFDTENLELHFNEIEIIGKNTFSGFKNLEILVMNNNRLTNLTAEIFGTNLQKLRIFSVSNNSISQLDPDLFKFTTNIAGFGISSNQLQLLPDGIFVPLKDLKFLYIQDNLIEELTENHIKSLKSLKFISIDHNKLTFIPLDQYSFPMLEEMRIGGNPWQCPCLDEVQSFLSEKKIRFFKKYYFDGQCPVCIPTDFKTCEKSIHFAKWKRVSEIFRSAFTEKCRINYLTENLGSVAAEQKKFLTIYSSYIPQRQGR